MTCPHALRLHTLALPLPKGVGESWGGSVAEESFS